MSRRNQAPRRVVLQDPKYGNEMLAKFVNMVMRSGKKSVAERIVYGALDRISERSGQDDQRALEAGMVLYDALYAWVRFARAEKHNWPADWQAARRRA